jgi:photosystem II stability/assembly factor-like uncharacterized protein
LIRIVALLLILSQNLLAESGWQRQTSGTTRNLRAISYLTPSTAVAVGDSGTILRTTDNGAHWTVVPVNGVYNFREMSFINSDSGFLASTVPHPAVHRTTNGGTMWDTVVTDIGGTGISFVDAATGHVCEGWNMYRTTDAGRSWSVYSFPLNRVPSFEAVKMFDRSTGIAVGSLTRWDLPPFNYPSSDVFRTTNAGMVWGSVYSSGGPADPYTKPFYAVAFDGPDKGAAVGDSGLIVTSTDGGQYWTVRTSGMRKRLYAVAYRSQRVTAVGDSGTILRSSNDGVTWQSQKSGVTEPLYGVFFANSSTGMAVGARGTILQTTSGGMDGVSASHDHLPRAFCLLQNYPNPFNPTTTIRFELPHASKVSLKIYNVFGQEVLTLAYGEKPAGVYTVQFDGSRLASGVYFYRLLAGDPLTGSALSFAQTKRLMLLK